MDVRRLPAHAAVLLAAAALAAPTSQAATGTGGATFASSGPAAAAAPAADPATALATLAPDGTAVAPPGAPQPVLDAIAAANEIATLPYRYGGGHGDWHDSGYDCSGSVSFALRGAGLLDRPLTSGDLMSWGRSGEGAWITLYAHKGHVFMVVAGLRFDTSGQRRTGSRWQPMDRTTKGFAIRHPDGL